MSLTHSRSHACHPHRATLPLLVLPGWAIYAHSGVIDQYISRCSIKSMFQLNSLQPYWSPSYPTTSPTAPLLLPSYAAGPYTEYTSVHPADITPLPSTYLLPVTDYQVDLVQRQQCNMHIYKGLNNRGHYIRGSLFCPRKLRPCPPTWAGCWRGDKDHREFPFCCQNLILD